MNNNLRTHLKDKGHGIIELLSTMSNYLFIVGLDGKVLLSSDSLANKTQITPSWLEKKNFNEIMIKEKSKDALSVYDLLILNQRDESLNIELHGPDGDPVATTLISSSILFDFYEGKDYILILLKDVREQKKVEMQLVQNNKMETLGEMASGIAHEINNPLTVVMGQLNLLRKELDKLEGDHARIFKLTGKIQTNFDRISKIVRSLQTMGWDSGKASVEPIPLSRVLEAVKDLSKHKFNKNRVEFIIEGEPEKVPVRCRETELMQVILNLVSNGIDSIKDKENDKWVKIFFEEEEKNTVIYVMDSGAGIELSLQLKLFEPFFSTKNVGEGTGLGLPISKKLIESYNGTLIYDTSQSNTCFKITIPN